MLRQFEETLRALYRRKIALPVDESNLAAYVLVELGDAVGILTRVTQSSTQGIFVCASAAGRRPLQPTTHSQRAQNTYAKRWHRNM